VNAVARGAVLALAVTAGAAGAEEMHFDPAGTESCLAAGPAHPSLCVGTSAETCMEENPAGGTTIGMGFCVSREWEYWDARLNEAYRALMAAHVADDEEMREAGINAPSLAEALRLMQRAWIPWRDAACDYERAQWGGGTGQGPATGACLMRLTADQALALEERLATQEAR
jgi:uncharacterized protein YecT (DUF1311 family)